MWRPGQLLFIFTLTDNLGAVSGEKVKAYNLNKYSPGEDNFDCLHTTRQQIPIPKEFSFCFRHKKVYYNGDVFGSLYIGKMKGNWTSNDHGFFFAYWYYEPWIGLLRPGIKNAAWVAPAKKFDFNMLTWRHTCMTISFVTGSYTMYENGVLVGESMFKHFETFSTLVPDFVANLISIGCMHVYNDNDRYRHSDPGIVTDFQLFGRILSKKELTRWTGCLERLQGDVVNWDTEDWFFNKTGAGSAIEYLDFEKDICDMRDKSLHLFPVKTTFKNSLELCEKVSGKLNE